MRNALLKPLSIVFDGISKTRNAAYDRSLLSAYECQLPVFCAGNVAVGGSGKSPFTQFLVSHLLEMGRKPAILMRGYRGSEQGPHRVIESNSIKLVGDEALMHLAYFKNSVPVIISKKRSLGAKFIYERDLADCIVLDDGFQHRALKRDINFLILDSSDEDSIARWKNGDVMPLGRLRESLNDALKRANALVYTNRNYNSSSSGYEISSSLPKFHFNLKPSSLLDLHTNKRTNIENTTPFNAKAVSAIANPNGFFELLEKLGFMIESKHPFPDHHIVNGPEWVSQIGVNDTPVITTAKDALKLKKFATKPNQIFVLELQPSLDSPQENELLKNLLKKNLN